MPTSSMHCHSTANIKGTGSAMPWQLAQCPGFINCDNLTLEVEKGRRGKSRKIGQKAENNKTGWFLERPRENCPCCPLLPAYINFSSLNLRLFYVYIYN